MRLRIDLAYDGTSFRGFAEQVDPDVVTVQGTLRGALSRVLGADGDTIGAGRTDAGVHALAQVVHIDVDPDHPRTARGLSDLEHLRWVLDGQVGDHITIWNVAAVDDAFDARFSAVERSYRYRICDAPGIDPIERYRTAHIRGPLDHEVMHLGAQALVGEHDMASLCRKAPGQHTLRRIDAIEVVRADPDTIHIALRGKAFCRQQVRSIAGILIAVGNGSQPPAFVGEVLAARDRSVASRVAPACGLTLEAVCYAAPYPPAPWR